MQTINPAGAPAEGRHGPQDERRVASVDTVPEADTARHPGEGTPASPGSMRTTPSFLSSVSLHPLANSSS